MASKHCFIRVISSIVLSMSIAFTSPFGAKSHEYPSQEVSYFTSNVE